MVLRMTCATLLPGDAGRDEKALLKIVGRTY
jgi:hypothetical protein